MSPIYYRKDVQIFVCFFLLQKNCVLVNNEVSYRGVDIIRKLLSGLDMELRTVMHAT